MPLRKWKESFRDAMAWFVGTKLLRYTPQWVNFVYDSLPHETLVFLVHHGFFGKPTSAFDWKVSLTNGHALRLKVNPQDAYSMGYALHYKIHDVGLRRVQEMLSDQLPPRSLYLDIGANIGVSSIYALSQGVECWLFEPNTALRPFVEALFTENGFAKARHEDVALSSAFGEAEFFISESSYLSSFDAEHAAKDGKLRSVRVPLKPLDSYLPEIKLKADHLLIKIDVEGHELKVLEGAIETLKHFSPVVMLELLHNQDARAQAYEFMRGLGYSCEGIVDSPKLKLVALPNLEAVQAFEDINFLFQRTHA